MNTGNFKVKFETGRLVATPAAMETVMWAEMVAALARHVCGDWGDLGDEDKARNDASLKSGDRLFSAYHTVGGEKFWIITEADRSCTTVLLPEDY